MKRTTMLFMPLLILAMAAPVCAQDAKPYKEGKVTRVNFVRTKPGQFTNYMKYLDGPYKAQMEALKKAGIITGYAIYESDPHSPQDANLVLTVSYPNMAALDRTDEIDAIAAKNLGPIDEREKANMDRESMRELLGSELTRELILK
jgi:hypothetical protein